MDEMINYFEVFGLPVQYAIDLKELRLKYYALSRDTHPDLHQNRDSFSTKPDSALVNKAYKVLSDKHSRLKCVLHHLQVIKDQEKYQLDPIFLMEMMEWNEAIDQGEVHVTQEIKQIATDLFESIVAKLNQQSLSTSDKNELKEKYYKLFSLERMLERA
jgi:molecular chaperone HscB